MPKFKLSSNDIDVIRKLYLSDLKSTTEIAKIYNISHNTVARFLHRIGCTLRERKGSPLKYSVDENWFNIIDDHEKSYFLGLLYADGCLLERHYLVSLSLQERDGYIVDKFINYINFSGKSTIYPKRHPTHQNSTGVRVYNKNFYLNLKKCGLFQNKSLLLKFPEQDILPVTFYSSFLRGYFDGDGSIGVNKSTSRKRFSILGTSQFLEKIQTILKIHCDVSPTKIYMKSKLKNNNYCFEVHRQEDIIKLSNFIYENKGDCFLTRKYQKFTSAR